MNLATTIMCPSFSMMIESGSPVILRDAAGYSKPIRADEKGNFRVGRITIPGSAIVGRNYGETVTQTNGEWYRCASTVIGQSEETEESEEQPTDLSSRAASAAFSSETFSSKTKFSQEKYLLKKHKKYSKEVTLLPTTLQGVANCSNETDPSFVAIGLMLRYGNAVAGSRVYAFDDGTGLLIAALLERQCNVTRVLAGKGTASVKAASDMGLRTGGLRSVQIDELQTREDGSPSAKRVRTDGDGKYDSVIISCTGTSSTETLNSVISQGLQVLKDTCGELCMYTHYFEQASYWQRGLRSRSGFINVGMREVFLREHQIMPDRTHPLMQSQVQLFRGFLVSATKVK